jgi:myo-inositol-1(or 4)-monophosphatase
MAGVASVDWTGLCRRIVGRQRELFASDPGIASRTRYEGRGEGGDRSLVLDRRAEDIVFEELERAVAGGPAVIAISEERGRVAIGSEEAALLVVIDPIDGSMNMRRTIPFHSLSFAVAAGDSMADVEFGFIHDFGADEEFVARAGEGGMLDGRPFETDAPDLGLEVVGMESAEPGVVDSAIAALGGEVYRLRVIGSLAITMSYVAAARFDGMLSVRPCRSVDVAAGQLIVREAGGAVEFAGLEPADAGLDLDARYLIAAAREPDRLDLLLSAQAAGAPAGS